MIDLLVIGAGLTGLTAAIRAAQAGLTVRVISQGVGSQLWGAGTIDLLGYLPDHTPVQMPLVAREQLPPEHPLRQVDAATIDKALASVQDWLAAEGFAYVGADQGANLWLPSAVGAKRPTYIAPSTQAAARLDDPAPLHIVGFDRLRDFYPTLLADNLRRQGHDARAHMLPLDLITQRHDANNVHLAQEFEEPARFDALVGSLRYVIKPGERIAFPAILGLAKHAQLVADLQSAIGAPIAEIPTLPPSVPGFRLHNALSHQLEKAGGRVETNMKPLEFGTEKSKSEKDNITWVATATSARPRRHYAHAYLLATGGFLGGGFNTDHTGRSWETVFNLSLTLPRHRDQWFRPEFLDPAGHALFQGGVQVNHAWQPVDAQGKLVYGNLWAAGNLLAHADAIRSRSHEALAIVTAAAAVEAILVQHQPAISAGSATSSRT